MQYKILAQMGEYTELMKRTFAVPGRWRMFYRSLVREIYELGVNSLGIVFIISFFIGAVITIQLSINISSPLIPKFTIGYSAREIILLEFSSTVMCLILAGKIGSSIASELGSMRVTEQIDALEIMGVNSANYLILPKIAGLMLFIPILSIFSMITGIGGGYLATFVVENLPTKDFIYGLQLMFKAKFIGHSIIKSLVYAFIISSVASYHGYCVKGGALQVGSASTQAVVRSSILILLFDVILTDLMLT
ncbi:MAG: ABC transporter permease [Porphyromonadaceae bacterium]|nr:ABC transporter permease [Porphyromonadaceae bacterium]